jgi:hypothetical protein
MAWDQTTFRVRIRSDHQIHADIAAAEDLPNSARERGELLPTNPDAHINNRATWLLYGAQLSDSSFRVAMRGTNGAKYGVSGIAKDLCLPMQGVLLEQQMLSVQLIRRESRSPPRSDSHALPSAADLAICTVAWDPCRDERLAQPVTEY